MLNLTPELRILQAQRHGLLEQYALACLRGGHTMLGVPVRRAGDKHSVQVIAPQQPVEVGLEGEAVPPTLRLPAAAVVVPSGDDLRAGQGADRLDVGVDVAVGEADHAQTEGGRHILAFAPSLT
jgi:hypothetical protein